MRTNRPATRRGRVAALLAGALLAGACSGQRGNDATSTTVAGPDPSEVATTTTEPLAEGTLGEIVLSATEVAKLNEPTALAARPSTPDLYVAERAGKVRIVKVTQPASGTGPLTYQLQTTPILDISKDVQTGDERGLLGIAFSSDGRKLYVDYTAEPDGRTRVLEYALGDRPTVDLASRRELLDVEQPAPDNNGGNLVIGPDGYLYVGVGDGGGRGDPNGRAQDRSDLLGKILRIDPEGGEGDDDPAYGVPAGNPYADGKDGAPEVWLYGVRNPWRFSFDHDTGDLWIADEGQNTWEEVDRLPAVGGFDAGRAANLGWDQMEGSHSFEGDNPAGAVLPIVEYSHDDGGCSVVGGYVYRGGTIEPLRGVYLYADYCSEGIRGLQLDGGAIIDERTWDVSNGQVRSFGQDNDGELFLLLESGSVLKLGAPAKKR